MGNVISFVIPSFRLYMYNFKYTMIHAFNFTCDRDAELSQLMEDTLVRHAYPKLASLRRTITGGRQYTNYGNGSGWNASMMKLNELSTLTDLYNLTDQDFVLSVDSDVVFTSSKVFEFADPSYGIIGIQHQQPWTTPLGKWGHMSGCLIFIRGDIANKMADLTDEELRLIRYTHFKGNNITENEDVVLSYLAKYCGANEFDLPGDLGGSNFEDHLKLNQLKSFYHLNYCPTEFLGEPITGKWDIPKVLEKRGILL